MKKNVSGVQVLVFLLALVLVTGVALADDRSAPVVNTDNSWPFTYGVAGQKNAAVFGRFVGADDYDFTGQMVATGQRVPAMFSLVPSTGVTSNTNFSGGAGSNFDVTAGIFPMANGNYAWFGQKEVTPGTESRGMVFIRTAAGAHVGYDHVFGTAGTLTRFNAALQVSGGSFAGQFVMAGFSTAVGQAGEGDIRLYRINAPTGTGTGTSLANGFLGDVNEEEAFAVAQVDETTFIVAGRQDDGAGDYNFFVSKLLFNDFSEDGGFTFSGTTEDGDSDVIRDILVDGNGDIIIIGTTGDAGTTTGYVAKLDPTTGELVAGYEYVTTETDVEFYKGDLMTDGDIVIVGRQGDDLFLIEIQDDDTEFVVDWSKTYDSSADGDIGYWVEEQADNTILVAGAADDGSSSTNAVFWLFDQPAVAVYPNTVTYTSPADEAVDQDANGVTLTWTDPGDDGGTFDAIVEWDVYLEDATPPTVKVGDGIDAATVTHATGVLTGNTTYYWQVVGRDAEGEETEGAIWSFTTLLPPNTPTYVSPADSADNIQVTGTTLTWADPGDDGGNFDAIATWDVFFEDVNPPTVKVVDDEDVATVTYATGTLDAVTTYYWYVVARDAEGNTTSGAVQVFTTVQPPNAPTLVSPADLADEQVLGGVTLTWQEGVGDGDEAVAYDAYFDDVNPPTTKVVDNADQLTYETGALDLATTYYWYVVARDADGDLAASAVRSFTSQLEGIAVYVVINSNVDDAYYDNNNVAGFNELAVDTYDAYDTPEPPALGANYIRTYLNESTFTPPFDKLTENYYALNDKDFETTTYVFELETVTDQDGDVTFTVDVTTGNDDSYPVVWWDGTDFQNLLGAGDASNTYTYTADASGGGGTDTDAFALLFGDETAPVVTAVFPDPGGASEIQRNDASAVLEVSFDNTNPIRRVYVAFSPEDDTNDPRLNWTTLTNSPMTYDDDINAAPDDPTDGITNANLTLPWVPYVDDSGIFSSPSDLFPEAQMRFITEDWAGNQTTTYVDFSITPDEFDYTGDYGAGWHLISIPMDPDDDLPADMFTTATGNDAGIAGDFTMFQYSVAGGYAQPTLLAIAKGYWIVLDEANTVAETNQGLGTVLGTIAGEAEEVKLTLDGAGSWNLVGIAYRGSELANALEADDWEFSDDDATYVSHADAVTATWISANALLEWSNVAGAYSNGGDIQDTDVLTPGKGYLLQSLATAPDPLYMRSVRSTVDADKWGGEAEGGEIKPEYALDEVEGEWFIPIQLTLNDLVNTNSGFGGHPEASDGWDNDYNFDAPQPPMPPTGRYVKAIIDHQDWNSPAGRYFVKDTRSMFDESTTHASWNYRVIASEHGMVTMTFDVSSIENLPMPEGFTATATVNGETYDLVASQTIQFDYAGGLVPVVIEASLNTLSVGEGAMIPTEYSIASAYPNPFNPSTVLRVGLPAAANMDVAVYNVLGKQVASLASGNYAAGYHNLVFDARDMASGVYFIRATVPGKLSQVKKVVLVR